MMSVILQQEEIILILSLSTTSTYYTVTHRSFIQIYPAIIYTVKLEMYSNITFHFPFSLAFLMTLFIISVKKKKSICSCSVYSPSILYMKVKNNTNQLYQPTATNGISPKILLYTQRYQLQQRQQYSWRNVRLSPLKYRTS